MIEDPPLPYLREVLLFLALAGVLIPLLQRLRVHAVLGFLGVGALLGPFGLGQLADAWAPLAWLTIPRIEGVVALAEVGVLFLMFMIGLDLSAERLWSMRRWVFGAGAAQVLACTLAIGAIAWAWGNPPDTALVLGMVLAFSSTAVVMQMLIARREMGTPMGRAAFSVLLFQDLAVAPALILVTVLGQPDGASLGATLGLSVLKAVAAIGLILWAGRKVAAPVFRRIAAERAPEVLVALTLLVTLGIAALTHFAGLSMALGALLAGMLLAETEFRHEVEVAIEPFRGLLMGLFFLSVGMGIDLLALVREPLWLPLSVVGLFLLKASITAAVLRGFGLPRGHAVEAGLLLGQGGEFAFIVIGVAILSALMPLDLGQFMMLTVGLSMVITPLVAPLARLAGRRLATASASADAGPGLPELDGRVLIAGYGRVGRLIGQVLDGQGVSYVAVDTDTERVGQARAEGAPVYVGDAARAELLRAVGLRRASLVVLTMDDPAAASRAAASIRRVAPELPVLARARDESHAAELRRAGATRVVPEALEAGLQLAGAVFETRGTPREGVELLLEHERARRTAINAAGR
jgi:CPA2 family monovalent cation:H+ antiporter-2